MPIQPQSGSSARKPGMVQKPKAYIAGPANPAPKRAVPATQAPKAYIAKAAPKFVPNRATPAAGRTNTQANRNANFKQFSQIGKPIPSKLFGK